MLNLCIVSSGDFFSDYGGGQVYVHNLVDAMGRREDVKLFVVSKGEQDGTAVFKEVDVYRYRDEAALSKILTERRPDIVHAHGDKLNVAKACKSLDIPCVVTAHHGGIVCPAGTLLNTDDNICRIPATYTHCLKCYLRNTPTGAFWYPLVKHYSEERYARIGQRLTGHRFIPFLSPIGQTGMIVSQKMKDWKELAEHTTHFVAPSYAIAHAMRRNGCPDEKITVIPHGIPAAKAIHESLQTEKIHFYYVGRVCYVKGVHVLLGAFHAIEKQDVTLHLIGGAATKGERRYMRSLQRKYRGDRRIVWHDKVVADAVAQLIQPFHVLVHPAIYLEVFGLNIAEAIAARKYVIATRCGGAEMQIHNEEEGQLVEPNNAIALREAMEQYIECPRQTTASYITIEQHAERLLNLYHRVTDQAI